ncbi:hypothetical protein RB594_004021 [Gaeumannomyces avenae]
MSLRRVFRSSLACLGLAAVAASVVTADPQEVVLLHPDFCPWNPIGPLLQREAPRCRPLIDDEITGDAGSWPPWTHTPICSRADTNPAGGGGNNSNGTKYCAFTNAAFRQWHGVSFVATPQAVAGLSPAARMADPAAHWHPARRFEQTQQQQQHGDGGPPYTVVAIPGKGKGVVARRFVPAGEVIMVDHPAVIASMDFPHAVGPEDGRRLLGSAIGQLPVRREVLALTRGGGGGGGGGGEGGAGDGEGEGVVERIMRANTFGVEIEGELYMGLYTNISRVNHACNPNGFTRFHPTDLTMDVSAVRDIQPYEEITISYIPLGLTSQARAWSIRDWGFECACALCSSPRDDELSDSYRARLAQLRGELQERQKTPGGSHEELAALAAELLEIIEIEGLCPHLGEHYEALSDAFAVGAEADGGGDGDGAWGEAVRYRRLALDAWVLYGGEDHVHVPNVRRRLGELERLKIEHAGGARNT